jgi:uncharacterized protein YhjY with autotransporter beta-barrel domain
VPIRSCDAQPRVGLRSAWYRLSGLSETGAGSLSLTGPTQSNDSVQADAGLRFGRAVGRLRPFIDGLYRRELTAGHVHTILALTDRPAGLFQVDGLDLALDSFNGQAGLTFFTDHFGFSMTYELQQSRSQTRQSLHFGVGF